MNVDYTANTAFFNANIQDIAAVIARGITVHGLCYTDSYVRYSAHLNRNGNNVLSHLSGSQDEALVEAVSAIVGFDVTSTDRAVDADSSDDEGVEVDFETADDGSNCEPESI